MMSLKWISSGILLMLLLNCSNSNDRLWSNFEEVAQSTIPKNIKGILLIRDNSCISCNNALVNLTSQTILKNHFILIGVNKNNIDVGNVVSHKNCTVLDEYALQDNADKLSYYTTYYTVNNGKIVAQVLIDAKNLDSLINTIN